MEEPLDTFSVRAYRSTDHAALVVPELLLVGETGPTIAGAVIAGFDGVRGWIYHLAVAPEFRRRGFATQLMRAAEAQLRARGCTKVNLQIRAHNREVVAFYRSLGYEFEERVSMGRLLDGVD
jgi:ribosomal protein S18 acetylase RimI-like enzyme